MARNNRDNRGGGSNRQRSGAGSYTRMIADRPATFAAIASGIAAGVVGFLAFKRSGKTFSEFSGDAGTWIKDGLSDVRSRTTGSEPRKDGVDDERSQSEIAEEAMTTKQTGKKAKRPVDPTIEQELKTGAISY